MSSQKLSVNYEFSLTPDTTSSVPFVLCDVGVMTV